MTANHIRAWAHYLTSEEGRSPATVREYLKDIRLLRSWLDHPDRPQQLRGRGWEDITASDLRGFLAELKPAPRRNHRLVSAWRSFLALTCAKWSGCPPCTLAPLNSSGPSCPSACRVRCPGRRGQAARYRLQRQLTQPRAEKLVCGGLPVRHWATNLRNAEPDL